MPHFPKEKVARCKHDNTMLQPGYTLTMKPPPHLIGRCTNLSAGTLRPCRKCPTCGYSTY